MVRRRIIRGAVGALAGLGVLAACTPAPHVNPPIGSPSQQPDIPADLSAGRSEPVADPLYPDYGNADVDVLHYGLALDYDPTTSVLAGTATITLRAVRAVDGLRLDFADNLRVGEATLDGTPVTASQSGHDVTFDASLAAEAQAVLTVVYEGVPEQAPAPTTRSDFDDGLGMRPESDGSLWTMQEPYGAFTWYPVNDHPSDEALYDITVAVPEGWSGVASGRFMGEAPDGDRTVFTWHSADPVASYLTTLAVDEFEKIEMTGPNELPITAWIPRESMREFEAPLRKMPEHIAYIAERYGPYPFDAAGVVLVGGESAMETQEMITFSSALGTMGPELIESVMVHELAHQWFGDAVTPVDWRGVWLNESMATYIEDMWNADQGFTTEREVVENWRSADQILRDEAGPPGQYDARQFASSNVYICTALMMYEIRTKIGESRFTEMMRDWVQKQPNTQQDRESFTAWVNQYAGEDLTGLIDEWLDSPTTPR
ncbi:M1 family metallopeptidase [Phytomonospora endophytica]|uniref:Aminopeptidase N n=1 Tax=Phytomonospora endophytica TaxID=714109 RepID=A0A841FHY4_9ACTN|nr:M1 family metallopeptidase [Phytomonospora endophytica]MBB6032269.1 aminopeptidase N [Phytomonospora endophytica]